MTSPRALGTAVWFEGVLRARRTLMARAVRGAARSGGRVVVGPWLSEIGFELLYWVPFVRATLRRHEIPPSRVVAISRGGPVEWYAGVADTYVDALSVLGVEEFRRAQGDRIARERGEKHFGVSSLDETLWQAVGADDAARLHPLTMYSRLRYYWAGDAGPDLLERSLAFERLRVPPPDDGLALPPRYVAAKLYFSDVLPAGPEGRRFVAETLRLLADEVPVVLLTTALGLDDHLEADVLRHPNVTTLGAALRPADNLSMQTRVIAAADALLATYGGPSYLGTFTGVPTVAIASTAEHNPKHLEAARLAARAIGTAPPQLLHTDGGEAGVAAAVTEAASRSTIS